MTKVAFGLVSLVIAVSPQIALADTSMPCGDRTAIIERLSDKYGEQRKATGLNNSANLVEVFSSETTGSWTILMTNPDGKTCLIAAGEHWDASPEQMLTGDDA
jgi:hypothetical protein